LGSVTVAVDVQNKFLGARGATRVYGPQKGIRPADFELAERCLGRLANVLKRQFGRDCARAPGTGAAGGLGFGLLAFHGALLLPGFDLFAKLAKLERHLRGVDLVITGEGAIDKSTLMGKGVGEIARRCRALKIPCLGLAGTVPPDCRRSRTFAQLRALIDLTSVAQARTKPAHWLERLAKEAALESTLQPATH
jgi:glycerate kinase